MQYQLVEAWRMNNEANIFLLDSLPAAYLKLAYAARTRTVAAQFAHMHNVRVRWLTYADPKLANRSKPFARKVEPTKASLRRAMQQSEKTVSLFLEKCEASGTVKNWNGLPATFLGYIVAHEAHHRGLVLAAVRVTGHELPKRVIYGLWDWGKKTSLR